MKTMCKRTLAFLLCSLLLCTTLPFAASAADVLSGSCGKDGDNVTWTLDTETGVLTISGTGEMAAYEWDTVPWFSYRLSVKAVLIDNGVTNIANDAFFGCTSLARLTLRNDVTSVGDRAFCNCKRLTDVTIPDSVTRIGNDAFQGCMSLAFAHIPAGLTAIGSGAFTGTGKSFYICADSADCYVKTYAEANGIEFRVCDWKTHVDAQMTGNCGAEGDNVKWTQDLNTGELTITGTGNMDDYFDPAVGSLLTPWAELFPAIRSITVENGVTSIGDGAFLGCTITSVTISDSVTRIGSLAFLSCTSLAFAHIPATVTSIGDGAFLYTSPSFYICSDSADCYAKTYAEANGIEFRVCQGHDGTDVLSGECGKDGGNVTWTLNKGAGVLTISGTGEMAAYEWGTTPWFSHGSSVRTVVIDDGVTSIGDYAFVGCNMTSVSIGNSVTRIGVESFELCTNLTQVTIGKNVAIIDDCAFFSCKSLADITIPDSVTTIGEMAFYSCTKLANVTIGNGVTSIGVQAFFECGNLTSVTIPASVTTIGGSAFAFCTGLTGVMTIPAGVTTIGPGAFVGCPKVTSFAVDENNANYSSDANGVLYNKDKTTLYFYPASHACTSFAIPDSVTEIGDYAFVNNMNLASITIPDSVTSIGDHAFGGCQSLMSVTISNNVTTIRDSTFNGCTKLSWVHIPAGVSEIESNSFHDCPVSICSDISDCYAKTYAEENGVEFRVCDGNHAQDAQPVQVGFEDDAFDVPVRLYVEPKEKASEEWQKYEFDLKLQVGETEIKSVYLIHMADEAGNVVQPSEGHPVTLYIPVPAGCDYNNCRVTHMLDDQGHSESFKFDPTGRMKPFTVSADGRYFILKVTSFSPFIVFEEQPIALKLHDTKNTLPFGEKRTLTLDVENLPDGAKIVWTADSDRVELKPSADGRTCEVSAKKNGKATVTATVVDADGNPVEQDGEVVSASVTLQTKANFFHKLFYWIFRAPWPFG